MFLSTRSAKPSTVPRRFTGVLPLLIWCTQSPIAETQQESSPSQQLYCCAGNEITPAARP